MRWQRRSVSPWHRQHSRRLEHFSRTFGRIRGTSNVLRRSKRTEAEPIDTSTRDAGATKLSARKWCNRGPGVVRVHR